MVFCFLVFNGVSYICLKFFNYVWKLFFFGRCEGCLNQCSCLICILVVFSLVYSLFVVGNIYGGGNLGSFSLCVVCVIVFSVVCMLFVLFIFSMKWFFGFSVVVICLNIGGSGFIQCSVVLLNMVLNLELKVRVWVFCILNGMVGKLFCVVVIMVGLVFMFMICVLF